MIFFGPVSTGQFRRSTCNMGVQGGVLPGRLQGVLATRCISYCTWLTERWIGTQPHNTPCIFKPHPHVVSDISSNQGFLIYLVKGYFDNVKSSTGVIDTWQGNWTSTCFKVIHVVIKRWGAELTADCGKQQMSGPYASLHQFLFDHIRCVCDVRWTLLSKAPWQFPYVLITGGPSGNPTHGTTQWVVQSPGQQYVGTYS